MADGKVGRPRKEDKYGGHVAAAQDLIADNLPRLIQNMLKLADGVLMREVDDKDGTVEYYVEAPDRQANQYLLDRVMGKPRQAVELTGKDGGAIPIEIYLPDNGRDRRDPEADPPAAQLPAPGAVPLHPG